MRPQPETTGAQSVVDMNSTMVLQQGFGEDDGDEEDGDEDMTTENELEERSRQIELEQIELLPPFSLQAQKERALEMAATSSSTLSTTNNTVPIYPKNVA